MATYEEWRVTGNPGPGFPPYAFVWTNQPDARGRVTPRPDWEALDFVQLMRENDNWADGPHLHRRTVAVTDWEQVRA
jgi:hypothetical protein